MASVMALIRTIAPTDVTVLITGESGTGKELAANEIYQCSDRMGKPFIKVNCAAIPAELLESELFGYEEGAFTGARRAGKAGMFELANTGVILLDEIGDMPLPLQTKLLRVLQQRELMRIGGSKPIPLDIRVIASTNKDLREEVRQGRFREDLYYRLNVVPIELKPLRERREDIPYLTEQFCRGFNKKYGKNAQISSEGMELILAYNWPGNWRIWWSASWSPAPAAWSPGAASTTPSIPAAAPPPAGRRRTCLSGSRWPPTSGRSSSTPWSAPAPCGRPPRSWGWTTPPW